MQRKLPRTLLAASILAASFSAFPAAAATDLIVSQSGFQEISKKAGVKIIDIRSKAEYDKGHIDGAILLPWQKLNVSERDGFRLEYAEDEQIENAVSDAGLSYDDTLLVYGATSLVGRAYVVLDYAGFSKVYVLDGGISQWKGKLSTKATIVEPSGFKLTQKNENRVDKDVVARSIGRKDVVILDGRALGASIDGLIPTAKAVPAVSFLNEKTTEILPREQLLSQLAAKGVTPDKEVISYCGSGAAASSSYLYLKDLGFKNVKFYDKSYDEWTTSNLPQTLGLDNFNFTGDALNQKTSQGPRFLDQSAVKLLQQDKNTLVVDVRAPQDFKVGSIPGSVNVYWNDTVDSERNLKSSAELLALFQAQGVTPDKHVVLFTRGGLQLSQAFTVLKLLGFPNVDAFEGKWDGWENPAYGSRT
ncbi:hypothetical protein IM720_27700 [Pseudomonas fluorescens]|uniref:Rhodanese domain-containing protein n=1 Tax=Pseudomonas fluorescens TaxID=294 RepID=A0A7M2J470_PSEFL|nr:rhodanese-like domain-containing protein [Pseudomonas fluorescens]QOU04431.1 hypothetical protein IM720_27700 [Pseudomonas fluorescens]